MFTLSADTLTVPAHGTATVTATALPELAAVGRRYLGEIVATHDAGAVVARTDVGLYKEDQRYTLHVALKDRAGKPVVRHHRTAAVRSDRSAVSSRSATPATLDLRLPEGTYSAVTYIDVPGTHGPDSLGLALLGNPQIDLDHDQNLTLDARKAVEVKAVVPRTTEDRLLFLDWYRSDGDDSVHRRAVHPAVGSTTPCTRCRLARSPRASFEFESRWRKAYPMLTVTDGGKAVSFLGQAGSSLYRDHGRLATVYAGDGSDYYAAIDATGKAVTRDPLGRR